MPFRARIKRVLTRNSSSSTSSNSSSTSLDGTRRDSSVYQPGEKMPPPKYRRPVAPEHKKALEAFSFDSAWRRRSCASQYSPMGSRMPSRMNSVDLPRRSIHTARPPPPGSSLAYETAASDTTDVESLSQLPTNSSLSRDPMRMSVSDASNSSSGSPSQPWTPEELALALKRSNLAVPP